VVRFFLRFLFEIIQWENATVKARDDLKNCPSEGEDTCAAPGGSGSKWIKPELARHSGRVTAYHFFFHRIPTMENFRKETWALKMRNHR